MLSSGSNRLEQISGNFGTLRQKMASFQNRSIRQTFATLFDENRTNPRILDLHNLVGGPIRDSGSNPRALIGHCFPPICRRCGWRQRSGHLIGPDDQLMARRETGGRRDRGLWFVQFCRLRNNRQNQLRGRLNWRRGHGKTHNDCLRIPKIGQILLQNAQLVWNVELNAYFM